MPRRDHQDCAPQSATCPPTSHPARAGLVTDHSSNNQDAHGGPGRQGGQASDHGNHEFFLGEGALRQRGHAGVGWRQRDGTLNLKRETRRGGRKMGLIQ